MLVRTLLRLPAAGRFLPSPKSAFRRLASASGALAALAAGSAANAQYFGGYDPCCPCQTVCQPVCQQQMAMVVQPCYQQVPVTEYVPEKQTVMRPQLETAYEEREFTEMRPVTETRTAEVPVTTYQPVTEMHSVCQDRSYYQTRYVPNCRMSPCQYDSRPGLVGWLNRTGYEMRSAFTPRYTAYREYVPNQVAMQVPVTRMVAQQGSRQVTYNETRYEAHKVMRQVAVTRTKMVAEEVTVSRPVTTYRTVPVGTTVAYAPVGVGGSAVAFGGSGIISNVAYGPIQYGSGATATALAPSSDPISSARREEIIRSRTAERNKEPGKPSGHEYKRSEKKEDSDFGGLPGNSSVPKVPKFRRFTATEKQELLDSRRLARTDEPAGAVAAAHEALKPVVEEAATEAPSHESALAAAFERPNTPIPFAVRSVRWTPSKPTGPALVAPALAAAE